MEGLLGQIHECWEISSSSSSSSPSSSRVVLLVKRDRMNLCWSASDSDAEVAMVHGHSHFCHSYVACTSCYGVGRQPVLRPSAFG